MTSGRIHSDKIKNSFLYTIMSQTQSQMIIGCLLFEMSLNRDCTVLIIKFIYSERRPQNFAKSPPYFCPTYVVPVKIKEEISQNFVAFSEYINFKLFLG